MATLRFETDDPFRVQPNFENRTSIFHAQHNIKITHKNCHTYQVTARERKAKHVCPWIPNSYQGRVSRTRGIYYYTYIRQCFWVYTLKMGFRFSIMERDVIWALYQKMAFHAQYICFKPSVRLYWKMNERGFTYWRLKRIRGYVQYSMVHGCA